RRNLDEPATRLSGLCRHCAVRHGELVAGVDIDAAGISGTGAACRDARSIGHRDRLAGRQVNVTTCGLRRDTERTSHFIFVTCFIGFLYLGQVMSLSLVSVIPLP